MRSVGRSALVPFVAREMFMLVDDVEQYPSFLPWCKSAVVLSRSDDVVEATLDLNRGSVSKKFTTRNTRREFESIDMALVDGPFRHLAGGWTFKSLGDAGSKVSLDLKFVFESALVDMVFGSFFQDTCNSMVDSFTRRAESVYGVP